MTFRPFCAGLLMLLFLAACEPSGPVEPESVQSAPDTATHAPVDQPAQTTPTSEASSGDTRSAILTALAAHPAGVDLDSADGRRIIRAFRKSNCLDDQDMPEMPFQRLCAWWASPDAPGGSEVSLFIDEDEQILGVAVKNHPAGVPGWDCQPSTATPEYTLCMTTRASSAQAVAAADFWNSLPKLDE